MTQSKHKEDTAIYAEGRRRFKRAGIVTRMGVSVALVASMSGIVAPATAMAAETNLTLSAIQTQDDEAFESDISKSTTISVTGTEDNVYTGEALDPIFLADSANSGLNEYSKSTTRPSSNWFTSAYLVEYENNTNAGTASYTITGGKDLGAPDWASKYTGELKGTFEIAKADLAQAKGVELADGEKGIYLATGEAIAPKMKVALKTHQEYVIYDYDTYEGGFEDVPDYMATDDDWSYVYRDEDGKTVDEVKTAGKYTVEAVAKSDNVTGVSQAVPFTVTSEAIDVKDAVFGEIEAQAATGSELKPDLTVTVDGAKLEKDIDYTVEYTNNVNVGTATATITGKGIYTGTASTTFEVVAADISGGADWNGNGFNVSVGDLGQYDTHPYTGSDIKLPVSVKYQSGHMDYDTYEYVFDITYELVEGTDYEVSYANAKDVWLASNLYSGEDHDTLYPEEKHPTIVITGKGNFKGTISKQFSITPAADISAATIDNIPSLTYTGVAQAMTVDQAGRKYVNLYQGMCAYGLEGGEGTMFTTSYKDTKGNAIDADKIVDAGSYTMVLTGLETGGFTGTKEVSFSIAPADFADVSITEIPDQTIKIDGGMPEPIPTITRTFGEGRAAKVYTLEAGKDFDVAYDYPETGDTVARMTITPKGNFTGDSVVKTFNIVEAAETQIVAPVTWASSDGKDWTRAMGAATTDGKVAIKANDDGSYNVTLTPSNADVEGIQYPVGTDIKAVDGSYTLKIDNLLQSQEIFVSVPQSPNKGYDAFMTIDLSKAEFALDQDTQYAVPVSWQKEDGSESMIQTASYIPVVNLVKTAEGYKAILKPTDEAANLLTSVNDSTEQPYIVDVSDPAERTAITFTVGAMPMPQTAYMVFADIAQMVSLGSVQQVAALIAGLPDDPTSDPDAVKVAQAAVAALNADQQKLLPAGAVESLNAAIKAVAQKADQDAVDAVSAAIAKAAASGKEADVVAARTAYDKLTANQKAEVSAASLKALTDAEKKIADKKAAANSVKKGASCTVAGQTYQVTKVASAKAVGAVTLSKSKNAKKVTVPGSVKLADGRSYEVTAVAAKAFTGKKVRSVTIGKNVAKIAKNAFNGSKATKVIVKTSKLSKKASVKGAFAGSKVKTVQVKVGAKKANAKLVKKYLKSFTKKNTGTKAGKLAVK